MFNQVVNMCRRAATQQKCLLVYMVIHRHIFTIYKYIYISHLTVRVDAWRPGQLVGVSSSQIGALLWNQTGLREGNIDDPLPIL